MSHDWARRISSLSIRNGNVLLTVSQRPLVSGQCQYLLYSVVCRFQAFADYPKRIGSGTIRPATTRMGKLRQQLSSVNRPSHDKLLPFDWRLPIYLGTVMPVIQRKDPKLLPFRYVFFFPPVVSRASTTLMDHTTTLIMLQSWPACRM